jgi:hypothetical protein
MEATNIEISVKGITTTLTFDNRTAELYQHQVLVVLQQFPNDFVAFAARLGLATLVFCGYCIHCQENEMPLIFSYEDFIDWSTKQTETEPGIEMINNISQIYLKLVEG